MKNPEALSKDGIEFGEQNERRIAAHFNAKTGTILLDLPVEDYISSDLSERFAANGAEAKDPENFHMTAVGFAGGKQIVKALKAMNPETRQSCIDRINDFLAGTQWEVASTGEIYGVEREYPQEAQPRSSVIEMVECQQLAELYALLEDLMPDVELELPPTHVTLATQGNKMGIGINTAQDLEQYGHYLGTKESYS